MSKIVLALLLLPGSTQIQSPPRLQISEPGMDRIFTEFRSPDSPGCAVGVVENQKLVFFRGYGRASLEYPIPLAADTVFRIGSTSKQFTAMAIQLLRQQGRLRLEDDIRRFIPELPDYGSRVTVRHLLQHTSGLRDYLTLMSLAGLRGADYYTDEQVLAMLYRQRELNFPPGEDFLYSNSGYFLLAEIVKRVSGESLRDFAAESILRPLAMGSSHFHDNHREVVPRRASGYRRTSRGFELSMTTLEMIGDGGLFTTVEDLAKWDANFYTARVGGQDGIASMLATGRLNNGAPIDYASGLFVTRYRGLPVVRHGGSFVGFRAELLRFPEQKTSIICLCNLAQANPSELSDRVADLILGDFFESPAGDLRSPAPATRSLTAGEASGQLGPWETDEGEIWTLLAEEGQVWLSVPPRRSRLEALVSDPRVWTSSEGPELAIHFDDAGSWVGMGGRRLGLKRAELVQPGASELQAYAGQYQSDELGIEVRIEPLENGLQMRISDPFRDSPDRPFQPTTRRRFQAGPRRIEFYTSSDGTIQGFRLSSGRVRNLLFERIGPGSRP